MTNRIVRPIRAWADYDDRQVYLQDYWSGTDDPKVDRQWFARWDIPTAGRGQLEARNGFTGIVAALQKDGPKSGSLRSLRVLYENGYVLKANRREALPPRPGYINVTWYWHLFPPEIVDGYRVVGQVADGLFPEDKDSEAVERAMIAAAAWFSQAEWARLETDSPPPEPAS
jgi:hypothetical protein